MRARLPNKNEVTKLLASAKMIGLVTFHQETRYTLSDSVANGSSPARNSSLPRCDLIDGGSAKSKWDSQKSNSDLMLDELKKDGVNPASVKVGVIDTSGTSNVTAALPGKVQYASVSGSHSEASHGDNVMNTYMKASPGSQVTNYPLFDNNGVEEYDMASSILRACDDGNQVINLSAVTGPQKPALYENPGLNDELARKGCILVQASGNFGKTVGRDPANYKEPSNNILTIGSTDIAGKRSGFSSPSMLNAPGEDIAGPSSSLISGTSFATPLASAVVKNVYSVLNGSPEFQKLSPSKRSKMVTDIVKASSKGQSIDGYRAVVLANAAKSRPTSFAENPQGFTKDAFARAQSPNGNRCEILADCNQLKTCYQNKRRDMALKDTPPSKDEIEDLIGTAGRDNDSTLASELAYSQVK